MENLLFELSRLKSQETCICISYLLCLGELDDVPCNFDKRELESNKHKSEECTAVNRLSQIGEIVSLVGKKK